MKTKHFTLATAAVPILLAVSALIHTSCQRPDETPVPSTPQVQAKTTQTNHSVQAQTAQTAQPQTAQTADREAQATQTARNQAVQTPQAAQQQAAQAAQNHGHDHPQQPPPAPKSFVDSLKANFRVDACCASKLELCAKQKPQCAIATRLVTFIDWMDSLGRVTGDQMDTALHRRYTSFTNTKTYTIDEQGWPLIGDRNAPLTMYMYFSGTCPLCKNNFRDLSRELATGRLRGRVKIIAKPFGAGPVNRALAAAQEMGRFSDFMLELGQISGRIEDHHIYAIANKMYLDGQRFKSLMESPNLLTRLEAATKEGEINGVTHVPTYFISGRRYDSLLEPRWIIDAIEFALETKM